MEERVLFAKGKQRAFLDRVFQILGSPSLRALSQFGFTIPYGTLKNYYSEHRLLPQQLFEQLCYLAKMDGGRMGARFILGNWGMVKGGKKSRRGKKSSLHNKRKL